MPDKERKPRAPRKKQSAANASATAGTPTATDGRSSEDNELTAAPGQPADMASEQGHDAEPQQPQATSPNRTTVDHMHEAFQRPQSFGEVF